MASTYRLSGWQRWKWLELPFATVGLVWNSMMSMAGGWFFLMLTETFTLGENRYRLAGIGSYMVVAVKKQRYDCQALAVLAMVIMIVALDQLLWRPIVVWAQKYRVEEGGQQENASSWFLNWLRRSRLVGMLQGWFGSLVRLISWPARPTVPLPVEASPSPGRSRPWAAWISLGAFVLLLGSLGLGGVALARLLEEVSLADWRGTWFGAGLTLGRVLAAVALGSLWTVPAGLAIGLSPKLSRAVQPIMQVLASFPAPMLFPVVLAGLAIVGVSLNWGSILLLLLGTQWYILFNVVAGAMAIPADLREMARSYHLSLPQRFRTLYLPAIFPFLVTGWVTAAGGAWNASIVSEYDTFNNGYDLQLVEPASPIPDEGEKLILVAEDENHLLHVRIFDKDGKRLVDTDETQWPDHSAQFAALHTDLGPLWPPHKLNRADNARVMLAVAAAVHFPLDKQSLPAVPAVGLGARISQASEEANYPMLAASTLVMALVVVVFNRTVWRACYQLAETRYSLNK